MTIVLGTLGVITTLVLAAIGKSLLLGLLAVLVIAYVTFMSALMYFAAGELIRVLIDIEENTRHSRTD